MNGKVISGPAAVLIIVLFFLPWITVSCEGVPVGEFSGYNLASGTVPQGSDDIFSGGQVDGDPILFVIPLIGLVTLVLLGITIWKSSFETNASWGQIIAAFIGLLVLVLEWLQMRSQGSDVFEIVLQPAMWGTIATLVAIGGGAVFDLVRGSRRQQSVSFATPPGQAQRPSQPIFTPPSPQQMPPATGDSNYTIMDEGLMQTGPGASETILDEDMFSAGGVGSETILDEDFVQGGHEQATVLGQGSTDHEAKPLPTMTPEDLPQPPEEREDEGFELVWKVDEPTAPSQPKPPVEKPGIQKTEVLHFTAETNAWLVIGSGERRGEQFRLAGDTLIGRETTNDIVIDDTAMSNVHIRIRSENDRFFVFDQNSTNGVFIFDNDKKRWEKRDAYELSDGDQIKIGRTVLHFMTS